jgi:hypothetical protein
MLMEKTPAALQAPTLMPRLADKASSSPASDAMRKIPYKLCKNLYPNPKKREAKP